MMEPVQYPYSLKFSIGTIVLMVLMILILLSNVISAHNTVGWAIFGVFGIFFVLMLALLVTKRLIPAIKGDIALGLDDEGINDYIRDVSIGWKDIKEVELVRGRSAYTMRISLKWVSDYGSEIAIPLRWVMGDDHEIYETVLAFLKPDDDAESLAE